VKTIEINGIPYALNWTSPTAWTVSLPLLTGTNVLLVQGVDNFGGRLTNAVDTITVTNSGPAALRPVMINEWMADNRGPGGFADPADGLFQDWFELFNPNTADVNLAGYYLTDNLSQPAKWRIPTNTLIAAGGFLLVWADNEQAQNSGFAGTHLHAAFQLSNGGEAIGLFAPNGVTPQSIVIFGAQRENISQGWFPDGNTNGLRSMRAPTPGAPNQLSADLRITLSLEAGVLTFTWEAILGRTYQLEYKTDLTTPDWTPLGSPLVADAPVESVTHDLATDASRFYRIAERP
jgi:hypothetical protein